MGSSCSQGKKSIVKRQKQQMSQMLTLSQVHQNQTLSKDEIYNNPDFSKFRASKIGSKLAETATTPYGFSQPQEASAKPNSAQVVSPQSTASPNTPYQNAAKPVGKKISNTEIFILERKRYMMHKGVYSYTPYTILPAPKLRHLEGNDLFARRKSSNKLQHNQSDNQIATVQNAKHKHSVSLNALDNLPDLHKEQKSHPTLSNFSTCKLEAEPTVALKGDTDFIEIEI